MKEKFLNAVIHNSQNPHTTVVEGAIQHIVKKYKVKEVFESSLGFEVDNSIEAHFSPGVSLPCQTIKYFTLNINPSDNQIKVYRKVNEEWHIEGKIDLQSTRGMEIRNEETIRIKINCEKDTSVSYTVLNVKGETIGNLKLMVFIVCSKQFINDYNIILIIIILIKYTIISLFCMYSNS